MRGKIRIAGVILGLAALPAFAQQKYFNLDTLGPDIPTPPQVIERMLEDAHLKASETLYDLGCGEGGVVIMAADKYKAHAVGIEIQRDIVEKTSARIRSLGLDKLVTIVEANALHYDLSPADVVTLYFMTSSNERLRPILEKNLKPTARVVSHDYEIRGWKPTLKDTTMVDGRPHTIYVYTMASRGR